MASENSSSKMAAIISAPSPTDSHMEKEGSSSPKAATMKDKLDITSQKAEEHSSIKPKTTPM